MDADGGWSSELAYAALGAITTEKIGQSGQPMISCSLDILYGKMIPVLVACAGPLEDELRDADPCVFVIEYCDGFRAFLLGMGNYSVPRNVDDGQICEYPCCC